MDGDGRLGRGDALLRKPVVLPLQQFLEVLGALQVAELACLVLLQLQVQWASQPRQNDLHEVLVHGGPSQGLEATLRWLSLYHSTRRARARQKITAFRTTKAGKSSPNLPITL